MKSRNKARTGARSRATVEPAVLARLERGEEESATLVECLALDFSVLLRHVFPDAGEAVYGPADDVAGAGIVKRMGLVGALLLSRYGMEGVERCRVHMSDTVRGWACFMIAALEEISLAERLEQIRPLADDHHFGVREWAWLSVRPHLVAELDDSIRFLSVWAQSSSERLRRFACEALRPRGVWCSHIDALKMKPEKALPILTPLHADPSVYVQDSVANWLNDAAKTQSDWVRHLCARWLADNPGAETKRVCTKAQRSLKLK